jgi:hypothetical protein
MAPKPRDYAAERARAKELKAAREKGEAPPARRAPKKKAARVNKSGDRRGMHTKNRGRKWKPGQAEKFRATMAARRAAMAAGGSPPRAASKRQLLTNGPVHLNKAGNMRGMGRKGGRPTQVVVLEADGTLATYVLTTVQAYVRQP